METISCSQVSPESRTVPAHSRHSANICWQNLENGTTNTYLMGWVLGFYVNRLGNPLEQQHRVGCLILFLSLKLGSGGGGGVLWTHCCGVQSGC